MRGVLLAAALAPAAAGATVPHHTVSWFLGHPSERRVILRACQDDTALANTAECQNAERAGYGVVARHHPGNLTYLYSPTYWSANPIARAGVLAQCRRRGPGDALVLPYCSAAARSALADMRR